MAEEVKEVVQEVEQQKEEFNVDRFVTGSNEDVVETVTEKPIETSVVEKQVEVKSTESSLDDYWNTFTEVVGTDYKIPEVIKTGKKEDGTELTKKEKFEILAGEISKYTSYTGDPQIDSFVSNIIAASKEPNFNLNDFVQDVNKNYIQPSNMSVDDKVAEYFKLNYGKKDDKDTVGLTLDEIQEEIKGLKKHEKVEYARKFDDVVNESLSKREQAHQIQYNTNIEQAYKKVVDEDKKLLDIYTSKLKNSNNVDGIELSEADHKLFMEDAPKFFEKKVKKDERGYNYVTSDVQEVLYDILASPEKSMALMPFLWMYKNKKLGSYASQLKEGVKKSIESKLGNEPTITESSYAGNEFNLNRFLEGK